MSEYTYDVKECGNYYELHRTTKTDNGSIEQPVTNHSTKKEAEDAGKDWQEWKRSE